VPEGVKNMSNPLEADGSWDTHTEAINSWLFGEPPDWEPLVHDKLLVFPEHNDREQRYVVRVDISRDTITVAERPMRVLLLTSVSSDEHWRQPFYKSSGYNSGMPGTWFPFYGLSVSREQDRMSRGWFRKYYYEPRTHELIPTCGERYRELERYGSHEMRMLSWEIARHLGELDDEEISD